jgi:hypothetical protein
VKPGKASNSQLAILDIWPVTNSSPVSTSSPHRLLDPRHVLAKAFGKIEKGADEACGDQEGKADVERVDEKQSCSFERRLLSAGNEQDRSQNRTVQPNAKARPMR